MDESQDNLLIDALGRDLFGLGTRIADEAITTVLRGICRNAAGLFWAGDTAQTISVGSAFRFDDLKSFLYRIEVRRLGIVRM